MRTERNLHAVTGAFGFTGSYIARRLLERGERIITLTNSPDRDNPFQGRIKAAPYDFQNYPALVESLQNVSVLYNNYWVRFNHSNFSYAGAVENSGTLFKAAKEAGVERIVHISITNPSKDSRFEYFKGKAQLELALQESGLSYAILRPAVIFGDEDILINNIAWFLRRLPVFGIFGDGSYRLEPIYVGDLAKLAVQQGQKRENHIIDAVGPETFTYRELVHKIAKAIGKKRPIISVPPSLGWCVGQVVGKIMGDVTITRDEIDGLMDGLLYTGSPPAGETRLSDWLKEHADTLGRHYSHELRRRTDRERAYTPG
jgi:NADH dehydrogenase